MRRFPLLLLFLPGLAFAQPATLCNVSNAQTNGYVLMATTTGGHNCAWRAVAGTGTVTSVGLGGTAHQITVTGSSPVTGSGSWTLSIPSDLILPSGTTATTQTGGDSSTKIATTAFVANAVTASTCTTPGIAGAVAYYASTSPCPEPSGVITSPWVSGQAGYAALAVGTPSGDDVSGFSGFQGPPTGGGFLWTLPVSATGTAGIFASDTSNNMSLLASTGTGDVVKSADATVSGMTCTSGCTGFGASAVTSAPIFEPIFPVFGDSVGDNKLLAGSGVGSGAGARMPLSVTVAKQFSNVYLFITNGTGYGAVAFYSGTTLVCSSNATDLSGAGGMAFAFASPCTLDPGNYYVVLTADNGSASAVIGKGTSQYQTLENAVPALQTAAYVGHSTTACVATGSGASLAFNSSISSCTWANSGPGGDTFFYLGWGQ